MLLQQKKRNLTSEMSSSVNQSPKRINKKQSLSILSGSAVNQLNNTTQENGKPIKDRVISESTGLIKFQLKKQTVSNTNETHSYSKSLGKIDEKDKENIDLSSKESPVKGVPIYVPIGNEKNTNSKNETEDLLFQMAAKQRVILDLAEQLKQAQDELSDLEVKYRQTVVKDSPCSPPPRVEISNIFENRVNLQNVALTIRKSTSMMTMNTPKINTEKIAKTQKQVADTFNQFTSNISNQNFLNKGKFFFESNMSKNIQRGTSFLNSIFDNEDESDDQMNDSDDTDYNNREDISLDENTPNFDYSVDYDLDRLNKINIQNKVRGTLLRELEDVEEKQETGEDFDGSYLHRSISNSSLSEDDYGGDVSVIQ